MSLFQKIIDREIPADIIYEDDICLAFRDIQPQAPVHLLLIPKKPIESLAKVKGEEDQKILGHMVMKAAEIAHGHGVAEDGFRLVVNTNKNGGQSVYHLHMHILGGRALSWPPG